MLVFYHSDLGYRDRVRWPIGRCCRQVRRELVELELGRPPKLLIAELWLPLRRVRGR